MTKFIISLLTTLATISNSFGQLDSIFIEADHYETNKFDVAIFPKNYIDFVSGKRFTPTKQEIDKAENAIRINLKGLNSKSINQYSTPIIHKNLGKYKRQYFGYIDKNGDRILLINCFWSNKKEFNDVWLKSRVVVLDGGSYYWNIKFNLDREELFDLDINGYG